MNHYDVIILGAGASGLFCALNAAKNKRIAVIDHGKRTALKVRISGGGNCNFTNLETGPENFISENPHFAISALARFSPWEIIGFLAENGMGYEEREHGQLFCDQGAGRVAGVLTDKAHKAGVEIRLMTSIREVRGTGPFEVETSAGVLTADKIVVALGGPSWAGSGATDLGFKIARQFGHTIIPPRPVLVPFIFRGDMRQTCETLAGISLPVTLETGGKSFTEALLFTHKGISGPVVLQASCYWRRGATVLCDFFPGQNLEELSETARRSGKKLENWLGGLLPKRLAAELLRRLPEAETVRQMPLGNISGETIRQLADIVHRFPFLPADTEGFKKAEATAGGVSTEHVSSRTMESTLVPGLYFTGEVLDVTGQLGGHNLHWAWASAMAAAQALSD